MPNKQQPAPDERAWRRDYQAGMGPGSDACPPDEELTALVMGEVDPDRRESLSGHITGCRRCARDYRTLNALHREAGGPRARHRTLPWTAVGVAAVLVATLGITLFWFAGPDLDLRSPGAVRSDGPMMVNPADGAVLEAVPVFSWPAQAGAIGYRVRLYDEAAEPLWESQAIETNSIEWPQEGAVELTPGGAYFWTVEAEGVVTRPLLGPFWFRLEE